MASGVFAIKSMKLISNRLPSRKVDFCVYDGDEVDPTSKVKAKAIGMDSVFIRVCGPND
jgi:hypothetical protein